jgi:hypothetical protein
MLEQIEGERPGCYEKDPDPDGPVREPVADLVALAQFAPAGELDLNGGIQFTGTRLTQGLAAQQQFLSCNLLAFVFNFGVPAIRKGKIRHLVLRSDVLVV